MTSIDNLGGVLVDTSAWIALMNKRDAFHGAALEFHQALDGTVGRITTWGIVAETYAWVRYHVGEREAQKWLVEKEALVGKGRLEVIFPDPVMEPEIRQVLERYGSIPLSYVDAFSLAVIRVRDDIGASFAFDHHLAVTGFPVLPGPLK